MPLTGSVSGLRATNNTNSLRRLRRRTTSSLSAGSASGRAANHIRTVCYIVTFSPSLSRFFFFLILPLLS
jgi:hypothetical protein